MPESTVQVVQTVGAIFGLLLLATATHELTKRIGLRVPIALVLVGIAVSLLGDVFDALAPIARLDIPPSVVFFVFLPTLVFEAAFNMDGRDLRENLGPVLTMAVPALLLSTLITGTILWLGAPLVGFDISAPEAFRRVLST